MIISGLTMMAIAFAEVSILARAIAVGAEGISGAILAVWAMGSIAGGIAYGARHWPGTQSQQLAFIMTAAATMFLPLAAPGPLLVLVPAALIAGLALAPSAAINAAILGASPSPDTKTEAFGWLTAATGLGGALGYALAGPVVDLSGERITIVCGAALAAFAVPLALALPHRTGSPPTRTSVPPGPKEETCPSARRGPASVHGRSRRP